MLASLRRLPVLDRIATGYVAVYAAWMAARALGWPVPQVVGDVAFFPLGLAVAWANWRASQAPALDARSRTSWRLLALAALVLWVSGSAWTLWIAAGGSAEIGANIDRLAFVQYVLSIAGYLWFPGRRVPRESAPRFLLDVALIAVAGFIIAFYIGLRLFLRDPAQASTLDVVQSSLEWALFVVAAVGCSQKRDEVTRRALGLLLASNLISLAANYLYAVVPAYQNGHPIDALWFSAWVLRWIAARLTRARLASRPSAAGGEPVMRGYRSNSYSPILVAGAFLLLFVQILAKNYHFIGMLAAAAMLLAGLLILRQFAELEENRRLFEARIEGEARFRSLVQNSSDVVIVIDDGGDITDVGASAAMVFGENTLVRTGMPFSQLLPEDGAAIVRALVASSSEAPPRFETRLRVGPDRWREIEAVWTDLRQDPAVRGIVIDCRDVTERKEIERYLRQTQELDAVGHLAGGLAHDLNNVLTVIRGYAELLRSDLAGNAAAGQDADQIVQAVNRASGATEKVLSFSRKQPGELKALDLNAIVRDLEPMLRHLVKDQVEVRLELEPGLWTVRGDPDQLEQVIVNLATNARDAMPDGGSLLVRTANRSFPAGADAEPSLTPGDYVVLAVSDTGVGISPAIVPRIFEPFFSTKPKDRAMGLGLAIVHRIVADIGGRVLVDTAEGRGSTFTVLLPRTSAPA